MKDFFRDPAECPCCQTDGKHTDRDNDIFGRIGCGCERAKQYCRQSDIDDNAFQGIDPAPVKQMSAPQDHADRQYDHYR